MPRQTSYALIDAPDYADALRGSRTAGAALATTDPVRNVSVAQLRALMGAPVNPMARKYGAVGDGVADDTAAVRAAVAAAVSLATWVLLPPGRTFLLDQIEHACWIALGANTTARLRAGATAGQALFRPTASNIGVIGAGYGSVIDGNRAAHGTVTHLRGVFAQGVHRILVDNLRVTACRGRGVFLADGDDLAIGSRVWADDCGGYGEDEALYIARTTSGTIRRPSIHAAVVAGYVAIEAQVAGAVVAAPFCGPVDATLALGDVRTLAFTSGGTYVTKVGDTITGATSGATATVAFVEVTSGSFAGGNAAGTLRLRYQTGTFQSETLNVGANLDVATIAANSAYAQPAIEWWGADASSIQDGTMIRPRATGIGQGIGVSIARGINCRAHDAIAKNFLNPLELAECTEDCLFVGGLGDCQGVAGSIGGAVLNLTLAGARNGFVGTVFKNFKDRGVKIAGSASFNCADALAEVALFSSHNGVLGLVAEYAPGVTIVNRGTRLSGTGTYPFTIQFASHGATLDGGFLHVGSGGGGHLRVFDSDNVVCAVGSWRNDGTLTTAILLQNTTGSRATGGTLKGMMTNAAELKGDGSGKTVTKCVVGGWSGDGGNIIKTEASSGTVGAGNKILRSAGFTPFNVTDAELDEFTANGVTYTGVVFRAGRYAGNPNGVVEAKRGSILVDETNGKLMICTASGTTWAVVGTQT